MQDIGKMHLWLPAQKLMPNSYLHPLNKATYQNPTSESNHNRWWQTIQPFHRKYSPLSLHSDSPSDFHFSILMTAKNGFIDVSLSSWKDTGSHKKVPSICYGIQMKLLGASCEMCPYLKMNKEWGFLDDSTQFLEPPSHRNPWDWSL